MADYWPQIITAGAGLFGTIIGGLISWSVQRSSRREERAERRSALAHAIAAEIEAYLDITEKRDHITYAKGLLTENQKGNRMVPKNWLSPFEKQNSPFRVLEANLNNIGILGDVCQDIATFYSRVMAVRTTLTMADEGAFDEATAKDVAYILENEIELWENANSLGRYVVNTLRNTNTLA